MTNLELLELCYYYCILNPDILYFFFSWRLHGGLFFSFKSTRPSGTTSSNNQTFICWLESYSGVILSFETYLQRTNIIGYKSQTFGLKYFKWSSSWRRTGVFSFKGTRPSGTTSPTLGFILVVYLRYTRFS